MISTKNAAERVLAGGPASRVAGLRGTKRQQASEHSKPIRQQTLQASAMMYREQWHAEEESDWNETPSSPCDGLEAAACAFNPKGQGSGGKSKSNTKGKEPAQKENETPRGRESPKKKGKAPSKRASTCMSTCPPQATRSLLGVTRIRCTNSALTQSAAVDECWSRSDR